MNQVYPERNPFPFEASLTIDGVEGQTDAAETSRRILLPTYPLPPVEQLRGLIERYFNQCDPSIKGVGLPVVLRGDHGTGKTHTIRYIMSLVTSGELRPPTGGLQPYQLYARAQTTNFMEIYRHLMRQVPLAMLRDLTLRFLGVVSTEIYGETVASDVIQERAAQVVIQKPEIINQAFREYLVGESEAKSRQAAEIQRTVGKEENFQNVIGYLLRDDLAETAYRWLIGAEVDEAERKRLGVSNMIETTALARWGIRFLATIFGRGGRPLIIYVDQYEKLLLGVDGGIIPENIGLMRALVEEIREANGMLVFAGNIEAWQAVSQVRDLRQRFGTNVIEFPTLTYDNANQLISLYLSMGRSHLLEVWALDGTGKTIQFYGHALAIRAITVARDGQLVLSASKDSTIKSWNIESGEILKPLTDHQGAVNAVALTPDQKWVVSGGDDHTVRVWDLKTGSNLFTLAGHENWVNAVVVAPNGRLAFSGSSDLTIRVWDLQNRKEVKVLRGHRDTVWALAITPDGKTLVSSSSDNTLRLWDLSTLEPRLTLTGHTGWVNAVTITPDSRRVISASDDQTLRVWDVETGRALNILSGHNQAVRAVDILPDGERVVSAAVDDTYNVWDLNRGELLSTIHRPTDSICAFAILPGKSLRLVSAHSLESMEGTNEIFPFEPDGIQAMLRNGGGNTRRLLQLCAEAFELAFPEKKLIDEALLERMLRKDKRISVDRKWVTKEIEKLMSDRSLHYKRAYPVGDLPVDFAILAPDGAPRLLVQVSEALFFKEEADDALSSINLIDQVRQYDLPAKVVLVVTGYASPEVTDLLRKVAHEAIVYEPDNFAIKFGHVLERLRESFTTATNVGHEIDTLKTDLNSVKQVLERIAATRDLETSNLEKQLKRILQQQTVTKTEQQPENPHLMWLQERKQIEERIRGVRKNQRKANLEELERLRKKATDDLNQRRIGIAVIFGVMGLVVGSLLVFVSSGGFSFGLLSTALTSGFFFMVILAAIAAFGPQFVQPRRLRELASEVNSIEELDRLARATVLPERENVNNEVDIRRLLRSSNPHLRYAGALAANQKRDRSLLVHAIAAERSTLVRMVMARKLGYDGVDLQRVFDEVPFDTTPELAYLVESAVASTSLPSSQLPGLPSTLQTLAVIAAKPATYAREIFQKVFKSGRLALALAISQMQDLEISPPSLDLSDYAQNSVAELEENLLINPHTQDLKRAFQSGLSGDLSYLRSISDLQIQNAMRELSPFEEGGLGTFDDLDNISKIDQYYMFFRQLAYYQEHGLLSEVN